jgi:hypothetical protein
MRRRDDADDALRSSPDPIGARDEMVLAQGLVMKIARHRGMKKAIVALARRLAVAENHAGAIRWAPAQFS